MTPSDAFKVLLNHVKPVLREIGYTRSRARFYTRHHGNWGVIEFQKSQRTDKKHLVFTINLGIASARLQQFYSGNSILRDLKIDACHWNERIGALLPGKPDKWWTIADGTHVDDLCTEIQSILVDVASVEIERYICDEALRELWLSGRSPGLTNFQRLRNLSVFLALEGSHVLKPVTDELQRIGEKDRWVSATVRAHLQALEALKVQ